MNLCVQDQSATAFSEWDVPTTPFENSRSALLYSSQSPCAEGTMPLEAALLLLLGCKDSGCIVCRETGCRGGANSKIGSLHVRSITPLNCPHPPQVEGQYYRPGKPLAPRARERFRSGDYSLSSLRL